MWRIGMYILTIVLVRGALGILDIDQRQNMWVTWAKQIGQDSFCLSLATPSNPFRTCLIGVPLNSMAEFKGWTHAKIYSNLSEVWNVWCKRPPGSANWCQVHGIPRNPLGAQAAAIVQGFNIPAAEPQELDLLGSVPGNYCLKFGDSATRPKVSYHQKDINFWLSPKSPLYFNYSEYCSNWTQSVIPIKGAARKLPPGIFLICGDRAWSAVPQRAMGGPCYFGKLTLFAPTIHQVLGLSQKSKRAKRSTLQLGSECDDKVTLWERPSVVLASIFISGVASAQALTQLRHLACWTGKQMNITSKMLSELATDVSSIRHAVLQNRAATDFLLLAQGHGCSEFEGMCCMNLSDHSQSTSSFRS